MNASASPMIAEGEYAPPLSDIETREKQRVAAIERALLISKRLAARAILVLVPVAPPVPSGARRI